MWSAIKSDFLNFVSTIQEDTTKTISKVLGDEEEEDDSSVILEKIAKDVRRSYETYGTDIKESLSKEYKKFKKSFNLGQYANDIGFVLDDEPEVSRFYTELVPATLSPEEFWARLFFRLNMVYRGKITQNNDLGDEDDDEELVWDREDDAVQKNDEHVQNSDSSLSITGLTPSVSSSSIQAVTSVNSDLVHLDNHSVSSAVNSDAPLASALNKVAQLETENTQLRGQIRLLVNRVSELEAQIQQSNSVLGSSSTKRSDVDSSVSAEPPSPVVTTSTARKNSDSVSVASSASENSNNSDISGVVVHSNQSDTMSFPDSSADDSHHDGGVVDNNIAFNHTTTSSVTSNSKTSQYLPAVDGDNEEDEENGWG